MTQEEKANAYDKLHEKIALRFGSNVAEEIFSEFEMSKDERTRKRILFSLQKDIMATKNSGCDTKDLEECIAWLEKQGKTLLDNIEYVHKDAFIEKATIWLNNCFITHDEYGVISTQFDTEEEMFEDFKNYMKGE